MTDEPWPLLRALSLALLLLLLAGVALSPWALRWPPAAAAMSQPFNQSADHSAVRAAGPAPA